MKLSQVHITEPLQLNLKLKMSEFVFKTLSLKPKLKLDEGERKKCVGRKVQKDVQNSGIQHY